MVLSEKDTCLISSFFLIIEKKKKKKKKKKALFVIFILFKLFKNSRIGDERFIKEGKLFFFVVFLC